MKVPFSFSGILGTSGGSLLIVFRVVLFLFFNCVRVIVLLYMSMIFGLRFLVGVIGLGPYNILFTSYSFVLATIVLGYSLAIKVVLWGPFGFSTCTIGKTRRLGRGVHASRLRGVFIASGLALGPKETSLGAMHLLGQVGLVGEAISYAKGVFTVIGIGTFKLIGMGARGAIYAFLSVARVPG